VGCRAAARRRLSRLSRLGRWRRLLVPTLTTLPLFALAVGLGLWQVHRLAWKQGLLAQIDLAERSAGVPLPAHPHPFEKVFLQAEPIPGAVGRYAADVRDTPQGELLGAQILFAVRPAQGGRPLLVMAGWAPDTSGTAIPPPHGTLQGYVRPGARPGFFSANDDMAGRRFFTLDPAVIGPALGVSALRPYVLVLLGRDTPGEYPQPATALPRPPNDHLQYAITWFSLGAVLLVIFGVYVRRTLTA